MRLIFNSKSQPPTDTVKREQCLCKVARYSVVRHVPIRLLQSSAPSFGVLEKTSLVNFQALHFSPLAEMKTFPSREELDFFFFFLKQEGLSRERKVQETAFAPVGRACDLCVIVTLESRTHPSTIDNVTGCRSARSRFRSWLCEEQSPPV